MKRLTNDFENYVVSELKLELDDAEMEDIDDELPSIFSE